MTDTAVEPPPAPVPTREKGYAHNDRDVAGFWTDLTRETLPELQWPQSIQVFDRMRRSDAQVSSVLRAVTSPIVRTGWSLDPNGARDEVVEFVANNLGLPIRGVEAAGENQTQLRGRDRFSWGTHVRTALLMVPFGHSYFEQVYRFDDTGRARLRKLAPRLPYTISQVNVARDGGLVSIEQHPAGNSSVSLFGPRATAIPVNRLVAYVLEREGGNWLGISVLRAAYKNWLLKDRALRTWSVSADRNGMGIPWYSGAEGETDLSKGKEIASRARAGDNSGGAGAHGSKFELVGVNGTLVDIEKKVRYHDEQIARAVLAHFLNLGTQTGSWALGSTFADFFTLSLQAVAEEFRETNTSHVVEDLVDINFGHSEPAPRIHFEEIGSRAGIDDELTLLRRAAGLEDDDDLADFLRIHVTGDTAA